ncbi:MAG: TonB-dependent receptor plug domain-containing protein, partial [Woeseiaceae bacterium]|nr:TonB-dependent receptor plug domain-containing protein [Woeseiaceae bacterium]
MPRFLLVILISACLSAGPAAAHDGNSELVEEVIVYGRSQEIIGSADQASQGVIAYDDIRLPPMLRVGELAEAVPGMVATQHSGTGKANQYFLRGFNLDHGTDFSAFVDGVPINMRTHGHGQGYLDLNFIIPELVEVTSYQKGPYSVYNGDFSTAGSVEF